MTLTNKTREIPSDSRINTRHLTQASLQIQEVFWIQSEFNHDNTICHVKKKYLAVNGGVAQEIKLEAMICEKRP